MTSKHETSEDYMKYTFAGGKLRPWHPPLLKAYNLVLDTGSVSTARERESPIMVTHKWSVEPENALLDQASGMYLN